jgi:hypothetical protein
MRVTSGSGINRVAVVDMVCVLPWLVIEDRTFPDVNHGFANP